MVKLFGKHANECQLCDRVSLTYVDGKTKSGFWANMCVSCHNARGVGLGTGKGQMYKGTKDGFDKVEKSAAEKKAASAPISIDDFI